MLGAQEEAAGRGTRAEPPRQRPRLAKVRLPFLILERELVWVRSIEPR